MKASVRRISRPIEDADASRPDEAPLAGSIAVVSKKLGVSDRTVIRKIAAGELHAVKCGAKTLVLMDSVHRFLDGLPPAKFQASRHPAMITKAA